jgi:hypothetical protein
MDLQDNDKWASTQTPLTKAISLYLSAEEAARIFRQFESNLVRNQQVLWSGITREKAQVWADKNHLQTLTTAMGPLMDKNHPECPKLKKSPRQWTRYVHGASVIFAWYISRGEDVTVLLPPPPERFHPSGLSSYQIIEEPITKGLLGRCAVHHIMIAHPTVKDSESFRYQLWPVDETPEWVKRFGLQHHEAKWRAIRQDKDKLQQERLIHELGQHHPDFPEITLTKIVSIVGVNDFEEMNNSHTSQARKNEATEQKIKTERKAQVIAHKEANRKIKAERKAKAIAREEALKKLKATKRKAKRKAKKRKAKRKAQVRAQEEAKKKKKQKGKLKSKNISAR